jgi:hypothetical protein
MHTHVFTQEKLRSRKQTLVEFRLFTLWRRENRAIFGEDKILARDNRSKLLILRSVGVLANHTRSKASGRVLSYKRFGGLHHRYD